MKLLDYVQENFNGNSAAAARECAKTSSGKVYPQNSIFLLMRDDRYLVVNIDGVDTLVKKYGEFKK